MGALRGCNGVENGIDLVDCLVLGAADLELDERRAPVLRDVVRVAWCERRADVADVRELRDPRDDVRDRGVEGGCACASRTALDQDVLGGRLLEAGLENPIHAAGLARTGGVVDVPRSDHATEPEGDEDEGQPAERRGLPVSSRSSDPFGPRGCDWCVWCGTCSFLLP